MAVQVPLVVRLYSLHYRYRKVVFSSVKSHFASAGESKTLEDQFFLYLLANVLQYLQSNSAMFEVFINLLNGPLLLPKIPLDRSYC